MHGTGRVKTKLIRSTVTLSIDAYSLLDIYFIDFDFLFVDNIKK